MKSGRSGVNARPIRVKRRRTGCRQQLDSSFEPRPRQHVLFITQLQPCDDDLVLCHGQESVPDHAEVRGEPSRIHGCPRAPEQRALHLETMMVDDVEDRIDEGEEGAEDVDRMVRRREGLEDGVVERIRRLQESRSPQVIAAGDGWEV